MHPGSRQPNQSADGSEAQEYGQAADAKATAKAKPPIKEEKSLDSAATWRAILRLQEPPRSTKINRLQPAARNRFNNNQLRTPKFNKFQ